MESFFFLQATVSTYIVGETRGARPPSRVSVPHRDLAYPHRDLDAHPSRLERWMMKRSRASQHE